MKKIIGFLVSLMMCFTLTSCVTTATAQVDDMYDDIDVSLVITYGTPFYNTEGLLLYYIYRDMFYYPFIYHDTYYFHRYRHPLPPNRAWRYKPLPKDFYMHHKPRGGNPNNFGNHHRPRPNDIPNRNRGNVQTPPRNSTTTPNRNIQPSQRSNVQTPNRSVQPIQRSNVTTPSRSTQPSINRGASIRPSTPPRVTNGNGNFGGSRRR